MTNLQMRNLHGSVYRSYLVRFWQSNEQGCWRASAQCVQSGSTVHFGDVASLVAFLQMEISGMSRDAETLRMGAPSGSD